MAPRADFVPVFKALKTLLKPYAPSLKTVHDKPDHYYLDTHTLGANRKPIMFAAARIQKNYVSYYFMPVYGGMGVAMSPELKKRMQGKACFNFTSVDPVLFGELADITRKGYDQWRARGWVE
jgi:hypothetical protein